MDIRMIRERLRRYAGWGIIVLWTATFGLFINTLHQMQTSEGVGLYYALKAGMDREGFDVAVDVIIALALLMLVGLPCLILRHCERGAFLRFLVAFLAFMPRLSTAYLVHWFDASTWIVDHQNQMSVLRTVIPFGCVLLAAVSVYEKPWKRWYTGFCLAAVVLGAGGGFWETELLGAVMTYLLLLVCMDAWERLLKLCPKLKEWNWILTGGLWLRAIYCLLFIRSIY